MGTDGTLRMPGMHRRTYHATKRQIPPRSRTPYHNPQTANHEIAATTGHETAPGNYVKVKLLTESRSLVSISTSMVSPFSISSSKCS